MPIHLITATDLKNWRGRGPQGDLPTLIRDLIWATSDKISHIAFPGGDSVYRPGFDGQLLVDKETDFIPNGHSVWEIGTNKNPKVKAQSDYKTREKDANQETTFVFVTIREFRDKEEWCHQKRSEKKWKNVIAYDADDLENWLSITPCVSSLWLEKISHIPADEIMPAILLWDEWTFAMSGMLSPKLICCGHERQSCCYSILDWIDLEEPSILRLKTYSHNDGKLFITASLSNIEGYGDWLVRCILTDNESSLRTLVASRTQLLIVTSVDNAGLARQAIKNGHKYCIITNRSATNFPDQDTVLEIPLRLSSYEARSELARLGMPAPQAEILLRKTGRMLMALRREVAGEHPCWAEPNIRNVMSSVIFASGWNESLDEDREALESLSGQEYSAVEKTLKAVRSIPESPIQYISPYWKLLSPMDAWRCLGPQLSKDDFSRFREVVYAAFTAPDPVMDLPSDQRWAAAIYDKRTPYSGFIRKGLLQSLIIIAEFGEAFLLDSIPNSQKWIDSLAADIFKACREEKKWESLNSSLKELAEAAPSIFLNEIERKLETDLPSMTAFFENNGHDMFSSHPHINLLWALERVAWFPQYLSRAANILIKLIDIDHGGNMSPRPLGVLTQTFCQYHPQTMATWDEQKNILKQLIKKFPHSAFDLMINLIPKYGGILGSSSKPDWREIVSNPTQYWYQVHERSEWYEKQLIKLAGEEGTLWSKIIKNFDRLQPISREKVIEKLLSLSTKQELKDPEQTWSELRNTLHHRKTYTDEAEDFADTNSLEKIYNNLTPENIFTKNIWIFDYHPKPPSGRKDITYEEEIAIIDDLRNQALSEILDNKGFKGVLKLSTYVQHPYIVGHLYGQTATRKEYETNIKSLDFEHKKFNEFSKGSLYAAAEKFGEKWVHNIISTYKDKNSKHKLIAQACLSLPINKSTWELVSKCGEKHATEYWNDINTFRLFSDNFSDDDNEYVFTKLMNSRRTFDLLHLASDKRKKLNFNQRVAALKLYLESPDTRVSSHEITETLEIIRNDVHRVDLEVIQLEWIFFSIYSPLPPQLLIHETMANDTDFFKEIVGIYSDDNDNYPEKDRLKAYEILRSWKTIPGIENNQIDFGFLSNWIDQIQEHYSQSEHKDFVNSTIGSVLAHSPTDSEGRFPCKEICMILDKYLNTKMQSGFHIRINNNRDVHSRSPYEGGQQERAIADKYNKWASCWQSEYPKVSMVLRTIADDYKSQGEWQDRQKLHQDMNTY